MTTDDVFRRAYASLSALRDNVKARGAIEETFVREYHSRSFSNTFFHSVLDTESRQPRLNTSV